MRLEFAGSGASDDLLLHFSIRLSTQTCPNRLPILPTKSRSASLILISYHFLPSLCWQLAARMSRLDGE